MKTYKWDEQRGYIIADIEGQKALIDTGAGTCVGRTPFRLIGRTYETLPNYYGATVEGLSGSIGSEITHLVGLDVLGRMPFQVDWSQRLISFGEMDMGGAMVPLIKDYILGNVWKLDVGFKVDGKEFRGILDTGAPMSYMPVEEATGKCKKIYRDFFPMTGEFEAKVYDREIDIGSLRLPVEFGTMPEDNKFLMSTLNRWIIGLALIRNRVATFDIPNSMLFLN